MGERLRVSVVRDAIFSVSQRDGAQSHGVPRYVQRRVSERGYALISDFGTGCDLLPYSPSSRSMLA